MSRWRWDRSPGLQGDNQLDVGRSTSSDLMRPRVMSHLLWALVLALGISATSALAIQLLGAPWRRSLGDALFLEGALLLVTGGLIDVGHSITFTRIRGASHISDPPPAMRKPSRNYILLIAGLLLCLQGALLAHIFSAVRG